MVALLSDLVKGYFSYEEDHHPEYLKLLDQFYQSEGAVKIMNKDYNIKAVTGHIERGKKNSIEITHYASDRQIIRNSEKFCLPPFYYIPSCNYMYYGFYLNVIAFLLNAGHNTKLTLYLPALDNEKISFVYRPEIAQAFLHRRIESLNAIESGSFKTKQKELFQ